MKQVHLLISGLVQGVGFRAFVRNNARKLGLTGWVRNLPDHRVEVLAQGDEHSLKKLIEVCSKGAFLSEVKSVAVKWGEPSEIYSTFEQGPTR